MKSATPALVLVGIAFGIGVAFVASSATHEKAGLMTGIIGALFIAFAFTVRAIHRRIARPFAYAVLIPQTPALKPHVAHRQPK